MTLDIEEQILRASKEIIVKFIEAGRISPTNFTEHFEMIYNTIKDKVSSGQGKDKASGKT